MTRKRNLLTVLLLSSAPAVASPGAPADTQKPRPAPADSVVPEPLRALRGDLMRAGREKAHAEIARFRPLCDGDGYPLVGNLAGKGDKWYQPSQFCSDVRKLEKRT